MSLRSRVLKLRQMCFGSRAQLVFFFLLEKKVKKREKEPKTSEAIRKTKAYTLLGARWCRSPPRLASGLLLPRVHHINFFLG